MKASTVPSFTCEMIVGHKAFVLPDGDVDLGAEIRCGKPAVLHDDGTSRCFVCLRSAAREGVLGTKALRAFRAIEARVMRLPS